MSSVDSRPARLASMVLLALLFLIPTLNPLLSLATDLPAAAALTGVVLGDSPATGSFTNLGGSLRLEAQGAGLGARADQGFFAYTDQGTNHFDVKVRVGQFSATALMARAGIMVRSQTGGSAAMAAIVATPGISGVQFLVRNTADQAAAVSGYFPVNYPATWLRLQKSNDVVRGFAGFDGKHWTPVGKATLSLTQHLLGLAASSAESSTSASALYDNWSDASGEIEEAPPSPFEPPGPSSRRTALAITEINYNPPEQATRLERPHQFIEVFNSDFVSKNLGGYRLEGRALSFVFPTNVTLPAGGYLVVAQNPAELRALHTNLTSDRALGPWEGTLDKSSDTVRLWSPFGALLLEVAYTDASPWPLAADGEGHTLVLARPSYGESDPRAWAASHEWLGSPGRANSLDVDPRRNLRISEVFSGRDGDVGPFVEIFNAGMDAASLDGLGVTGEFAKSEPNISLPATTLEPGARIVVGRPAGTPLPSPLFIRSQPNHQVWDAIAFDGSADTFALGRVRWDSQELRRLTAPTPGQPNAAVRPPRVVISEIMVRPVSGRDDDQFIELWNPGTELVSLDGWRLHGGVEFDFPSGHSLAPGERIVVARNAARLRQTYPNLSPARIIGEFSGRLASQGERINLLDATGAVEFGFAYHFGGEWPALADGGGSSLELLHPGLDPELGSSWAASDESQRAHWQTFEISSRLESGTGAITDVRLLLLDPGECLVDDVEVFAEGSTNLLANPDFESGQNGWTAGGTHERSTLSTNGGFGGSAQSLRVRAMDRGDNGINSVRATLRTGLRSGTNATLRLRARWLAGARDLLFRVKGNYLELPIHLDVPEDLGTPGLPNSRSLPSPRAALTDLTHFPVLPADGQPVRVTVRVSGHAGTDTPVLRYRLDPSNEFADPIPMNDSGTDGDRVPGDGLFTAVIPGQPARVMAAFHVDLGPDGFAFRAPSLTPDREALVRWGEVQPAGNLGVYRVWITRASENRWSSRPKLHNGDLDGTFVYGNSRAIYGLGALYSGSPFVSPGYNGPAGTTLCGYVLHFPDDDAFLGETDFVMDWPIRDETRQLEQRAYEFAEQIGLPFLHRRFVHLFVNSSKRGTIYEDTQQPGSAYLRNWFPDDNDGHLHKIEDWFEFGATGEMEVNNDAVLDDFRRSDGSRNRARYRWNFRPRAVQGSSHDFEPLYRLVDAAVPPAYLLEFQRDLEREMNIDEWAGVFALEHAVGNWDSFGYSRGKNMYAYRPQRGPWQLLMWDIDFLLSASGEGPGNYPFSTIDATLSKLYQLPFFQRAYWRAVKKLLNGPMHPDRFNARTEEVRQGLLDNGVSSTSLTAARNWVRDQRNILLAQIDSVDQPFTLQSNLENGSTSDPFLHLSGEGPLEMVELLVNGQRVPVSWSQAGAWTANVPLTAGPQSVSITPIDITGRILATPRNISANLTAPPTSEADRIVINEIHVTPKIAGASFVELFNPSTNQSFDLSGLQLVGAGAYEFPENSMLFPGQLLVLGVDIDPFQAEFGRNAFPAARLPWIPRPEGETLAIVRPADGTNPAVTLTAVTYRSDTPWTATSPGQSLQLRDASRGEDDRVGNWAIYSPPTNASPWKSFTVTGPARSTNLLLYVSSYPPSLSPTDLAGRWTGLLSSFSFAFAANFSRRQDGALSGSFVPGDTTDDPELFSTELSGVEAETDGAIRFTWPEINGRFTGRIDASGRRATGNFVYDGGTSPFTMTRQLPGGTVLVDDLTLTRVGDDSNLLRNGDFQADLGSDWQSSGAHVDSVRVDPSDAPGSGAPNFALRLSATAGGNGSLTNAVSQAIPNVFIGSTYRLSGRYLAVEAKGFVVGIEGGPRFSADLRPRTDSGPNATPGRLNSVTESLSPIPLVWLNEIQPVNNAGLRDADGEFEPWLELHNSGASDTSLDGYYLTDDPAQPRKWPLPSGTVLPPGGFLIVWLDGEPAEGTPTAPHANFRPSGASGVVILNRVSDAAPFTVDFLRYSDVPPTQSYGHHPESWVHSDNVLSSPSPGASNAVVTEAPRVWINEWMASNDGSVRDPADLDPDDWFELYNPGSSPVDLGGWLLSDTSANVAKFQVPAGTTVPARGFLLVWADEESGQTTPSRPDLHVNFRLAGEGEEILLSRPDGTRVDHVIFGQQTSGTSQGRQPDGSPGTHFVTLLPPSPGQPNAASHDDSPQIVLVERQSNASLILRFAASPGAQYRLQTTEDLSGSHWTPTTLVITANGPFAELTWPLDASAHRFLRVERLP